MCAACREHGLEPIVTFHHFTTPRWVAARGGLDEPATADRFARFCERATAHLGDLIARACTLNEPNIVATFGHRYGLFPPGQRDPDLRRRANDVFIAAHRKAVAAIRAGRGRAPGRADARHVRLPGGRRRRGACATASAATWRTSSSRPPAATTSSASRCYTRIRYRAGRPARPRARTCRLTQMGYEFWPEALEATIRRAWEVTGGVPVLVTENGIGTERRRRAHRVRRARAARRARLPRRRHRRARLHLLEPARQLRVGPRLPPDVRPRRRRPRDADAARSKPSARWLGDIARRNALPGPAEGPGFSS